MRCSKSLKSKTFPVTCFMYVAVIIVAPFSATFLTIIKKIGPAGLFQINASTPAGLACGHAKFKILNYSTK